jgi:MFS family permease
MPELAAASSLTRHRSFVLFWCARTFTNGAYMMQGVAVGWQIYELTNDPFDLGLVGLAQFLPLVGFSIVIGQVADLFDRRLVIAICQLSKAVAALALAVGTARNALSRDAMLAILLASGTARAFEIPTIHALLPGIVPAKLLPRAIAASASAQQTAVICGPSLGGLLYTFSPTGVYATCTVVFIAASVFISLVRVTPRNEERKPISLATLFAGFRYISAHPILLGAISLDLFAVLLGGVTALLPIYARDILHAGPWALGVLRSAPAVGALAISIALARARNRRRRRPYHVCRGRSVRAREPRLRAVQLGRASFLALMVYGASDAISVVIRQSLVQMRTPYEMLGRVLAVNSMFTGSSGALGEFRAGAVAAALGAVPSALIGGLGTIAVMLIWMWAFPQLRRVDKLAPDESPAA